VFGIWRSDGQAPSPLAETEGAWVMWPPHSSEVPERLNSGTRSCGIGGLRYMERFSFSVFRFLVVAGVPLRCSVAGFPFFFPESCWLLFSSLATYGAFWDGLLSFQASCGAPQTGPMTAVQVGKGRFKVMTLPADHLSRQAVAGDCAEFTCLIPPNTGPNDSRASRVIWPSATRGSLCL